MDKHFVRNVVSGIKSTIVWNSYKTERGLQNYDHNKKYDCEEIRCELGLLIFGKLHDEIGCKYVKNKSVLFLRVRV